MTSMDTLTRGIETDLDILTFGDGAVGLLTDREPVHLTAEVVRTEPAERELPPWLADAVRVVAGYTRLPQDWDTYGAPPAQIPIVTFALVLLGIVASRLDVTRAPTIVPTNVGGVAFEWTHRGRTLQVEVDRPDLGCLYFTDPASGVEREIEFRTADVLVDYLQRVFT